MVTMEWLDDCLRLRRVLPAWPLAAVDDVLHRPKVTALGAPGAAELRLAQTNFRGEGRGIVQDLSEWLGIPHTKDLKKENTHLVCNVFTGQKYDRAKEWNVKAVNMLWLEDSIWEWELQPTDKYEQLDSKDAKAQAGLRQFQPPEPCSRTPMSAEDAIEDSMVIGSDEVSDKVVEDSAGADGDYHGGAALAGAAEEPEVARPATSDETNDSNGEAELARTVKNSLLFARWKCEADKAGTLTSPPKPTAPEPAKPILTPQSVAEGDAAAARVTPPVTGAAAKAVAVSPVPAVSLVPIASTTPAAADAGKVAGAEPEDDADTGKAGKPRPTAKRSFGHTESQAMLGPLADAAIDVFGTAGDAMEEDEDEEPAAAPPRPSLQEVVENHSQPEAKPPPRKKKARATTARAAAKSEGGSGSGSGKKRAAPGGSSRRAAAAAPADVCITLSGMHTAERDRHTRVCGRLGFALVSESREDEAKYRYREGVTHVVATAPLGRTAKLLYALAAGVWIVRPSWLEACAKAGRPVAEADHEWAGDTKGAMASSSRVDAGAAKRWRMHRESRGQRTLEGLKFCLVGTFEKRVPDLLRGIVAAGGAEMVQKGDADLDYALFPTSGPVSAAARKTGVALKARGVACITQDFVLNWLAMPSADLGKFVLLDTQGAAEAIMKRSLATPAKRAKKASPGR